jgi:flagellar M-ring protein FliF
MNEQFKNFWEVCKGIWASLGVSQKISIILIGILCFTGLSAVVYYGTKAEYGTLFTNVDPKDMSKVTEILIEENIEYRIKGGGTTIEIPVQNIIDMKVKIRGSKDINLGGDEEDPFGYINDMSLAMSSDEKRIAWLSAMQKNLQYQINKMPKVSNSRVTLNLPSKRAFEKQKESTASVMLYVRNGSYISDEQIASIRHLVASSVENLQPNKVTIVDSLARLLAKNDDEDAQGATLENNRREMKAKLEHDLRRKVEDILIPAVGGKPEFVVAMVDVELSFQKETQTIEKFEEGVAESKKSTTETTSGAGSNSQTSVPAGVSGNEFEKISVKSTEGAPEMAEKSGAVTKQTIESILKVPKSISTISKDGAAIKRLTVSVNINKPDEKGFSEEQMTDFEELVKTAVGYVEEVGARVDKVTVKQTMFTVAEVPEVASTAMNDVVDQVDFYMNTSLARNIMGGVLLLALLIFYKKIFTSEKIESQDMNADDVEGELVETDDHRAGRLAEEAELALLEVELSKEMEAIKGASKNEPETIASVIESWVMTQQSE